MSDANPPAGGSRLSRLLRRRPFVLSGAVGLLVAIAVLALGFAVQPDTPVVGFAAGTFRFLDNGARDALMRARGDWENNRVDSRVVIVEIGDKSLETLGEFPVPRWAYTKFFDATREAAAVGVDILFTDASSRISQESFALELAGASGEDAAMDAFRRAQAGSDRDLAQMIREAGNVVLPATLPDPLPSRSRALARVERARSAYQDYENRHNVTIALAPDGNTHLKRLQRESGLLYSALRQAYEVQKKARSALARQVIAQWRADPTPATRRAIDEWWEKKERDAAALKPVSENDEAAREEAAKPDFTDETLFLSWILAHRKNEGVRRGPWDEAVSRLQKASLAEADLERMVVETVADGLWEQKIAPARRSGVTAEQAFLDWAKDKPEYKGITRIEERRASRNNLSTFDLRFRARIFAEKGAPIAGKPFDRGVPIATSVVGLPMIGFLERLPEVSYISAVIDGDGVLRRYAPVLRLADPESRRERYYPSLAVGALAVARGKTMKDIEVRPGRFIRIPAGHSRPQVTLPIDEDGTLVINWAGRWKTVFEHIEFSQVLDAFDEKNGSEDKRERMRRRLRGAYVFLGLTATGSHDLKPSPIESAFPMVGAHAHVVNSALTGQYFTPGGRWNLLVSVIAAALALGLGLCMHRLRAWVWVGVVLGASLGWVALARSMVAQSQDLPVVEPLLALVLASLASAGFNSLVVERRRRQVQKMFATYLAPQVVTRLLDEGAMSPGGEKREVSILFSDIVGFTTLSQGLDSRDLLRFLNEYLTEMERIVTESGGIVDKYIGDAVMAFFGAPDTQKRHGLHALRAAVRMQERIARLNEGWSKRGLPSLGVRVGVNTGEVVVGNLGSPNKVDYTVIGDAVNVAARLESGGKFWGFRVMTSGTTRAQLNGAIPLVLVGRIRLKGKTEGVEVYGVPRPESIREPGAKEVIRRFDSALERFTRREFASAGEEFALVPQSSFLGVAASRYVEACARLDVNPPLEDWAGEFVMETK